MSNTERPEQGAGQKELAVRLRGEVIRFGHCQREFFDPGRVVHKCSEGLGDIYL